MFDNQQKNLTLVRIKKTMIKLKEFRFIQKDLIFVLLFTVFAVSYYDSVLDKGPLNTHVWRQTDCLSLTHYYANGSNFFSPEMHIQLGDNKTSGRTAGEFPILYFIVGILWSLFGESYIIYRLFYLMILFLGLFSFYKSLQILFKDFYWSIVVSLLLFTSPVYVFYGVSFLTDIPAMSFIFIALYFLLQYSQKKIRKFFFVSMGFFALAGLIKISSLIAFVFISIIFLLELFSIKTLGSRKLFNHQKLEWIGFSAVVLCIFSWYSYAHYYNSIHTFKYTFNSIHPLWLIGESDIHTLIKDIKSFVSQVFFSKPILYAFMFTFIMNLTLWKKIPLFAYLSNIIIAIGSIIYFILWAPLMGIHDYYYSALLILFIGILIPFIWFIRSNYPDFFKGYRLKTFIGLFLIYNFFYCVSVTKLKTLSTKNNNYIMIGNHDFVDFMTWTNWDVQNNWHRYEKMRPYIREIGIKEEDKVICIPDASFNSSLFLLNQKGWTNFENYSTTKEIEELIQKGAKYLFISNPDFLNKEFLTPFLTEQIGDYKGIKIFKL